jgi:hypothetical protein
MAVIQESVDLHQHDNVPSPVHHHARLSFCFFPLRIAVCVCLLLQYLLQSCSRGWEGGEGGHALRETVCVCLLLQPSTYYKAVRVYVGGKGGGHALRETKSRGLCGLVCRVCLLLQYHCSSWYCSNKHTHPRPRLVVSRSLCGLVCPSHTTHYKAVRVWGGNNGVCVYHALVNAGEVEESVCVYYCST